MALLTPALLFLLGFIVTPRGILGENQCTKELAEEVNSCFTEMGIYGSLAHELSFGERCRAFYKCLYPIRDKCQYMYDQGKDSINLPQESRCPIAYYQAVASPETTNGAKLSEASHYILTCIVAITILLRTIY